MKEYPSIGRDRADATAWYCFDKLDGSAVRAEWNDKKKTFTKFGSRHHLIDASDKQLGKAVTLIQNKYLPVISEMIKDNRWKNCICFFEYFGPNSFAGNHDPSDTHDVVLLDYTQDNRGITPPGEFIHAAMKYHIEVPRVLFVGNPDETIYTMIRESKMPNMTFEGAVFKAAGRPGLPHMFKVKSDAWLAKLKTFCKNDEKLFRSLE